MAILLPSWPILGATLRILAPALMEFFGNSSLHRAKVEKIIQEPLRTYIFYIFGASGRRFSSLSALRFLGFRLCCPSSVHASIFLSHTFCTYSLRVFPNTAGHQIVLRRLLREACSIRRSTSSATAPCKTTISNSKVPSGWGFPHPYPPRGHASAAGRRPLLFLQAIREPPDAS